MANISLSDFKLLYSEFLGLQCTIAEFCKSQPFSSYQFRSMENKYWNELPVKRHIKRYDKSRSTGKTQSCFTPVRVAKSDSQGPSTSSSCLLPSITVTLPSGTQIQISEGGSSDLLTHLLTLK